VHTVAFQGIQVVDVDVQVQMSAGLPAFSVVGLADKAVAESRERAWRTRQLPKAGKGFGRRSAP
jgi:hypothetical protein